MVGNKKKRAPSSVIPSFGIQTPDPDRGPDMAQDTHAMFSTPTCKFVLPLRSIVLVDFSQIDSCKNSRLRLESPPQIRDSHLWHHWEVSHSSPMPNTGLRKS